MKFLSLLFSFMLAVGSGIHSQNPAPAKPQTESILIMNATAHLGNGQVIANAAIGFDHGKLILVSDATNIRLDKLTYKKIIDASGKHVYPGFIDCNSNLGLAEI